MSPLLIIFTVVGDKFSEGSSESMTTNTQSSQILVTNSFNTKCCQCFGSEVFKKPLIFIATMKKETFIYSTDRILRFTPLNPQRD